MSKSKPPVIRAMAKTLTDHQTDPWDSVAVITTLLTAGWTAKELEPIYDEVVMMAAIRRSNEERRRQRDIVLRSYGL